MFAATKHGFVPILTAWPVFALLLTAVFPFDPANAQDLDAGVVKLLVTTHEGVHRFGSGFIARLDSDRAYVVTAAHVVEGSREVGVIFSGARYAEPVSATVVDWQHWDRRGLLLLRLPAPAVRSAGARSLPLSSAGRVAKGQEVFVLGHPRVVGARRSRCRLTWTRAAAGGRCFGTDKRWASWWRSRLALPS